MTRPFLTARWTNLAIVTYPAPPALLEERVPPGLELETRAGDAFVSLVAFDFRDTRVWGVPWPGYRNFAELNLRYYVRRGEKRGVVFVREFVRPRLVAWLARVLYNEPYAVAALETQVRDTPERLTMELRLTYAGSVHAVAVTGRKPGAVPGHTSDEHFFKEHRWGFGVNRRGRTIRYEVDHPLWQVYPVESHRVEMDWAAVYGPEWGVMAGRRPCSVMLASGSTVALYRGACLPAAETRLACLPLPAGEG